MSEKLIKRSPIVVLLGHVDHGKSSLLEAIKDLKITTRESGGITQHIGAYEIKEKDKKITFIDTPGHALFSSMRSRGVCLADIAVLVIAADDGIKEQTKEVIDHIKNYNIPFVVAINKIDKPEANVEKIKRQLAEKEIYLETMGGKVPFVEVSAINKKGIEHLLEVILLLAEVENIKADTSCFAQGIVLESCLDQNRGPVATLIIKKGILEKGNFLSTPSATAKIKNLANFQGKQLEQGFPAMPVEILGFDQVPQAGESFCASDKPVKKETVKRSQEKKVCLGEKTLPLIIKTDVLGSVEAIKNMIEKIPQEKVKVSILKIEPGQISEVDVKMAIATKAKILCFRSKANKMARNLAQREEVKILNFDVIYELGQAVENVLRRMVEPDIFKKIIGKLKILEIFKTEKKRQIIGGKVIQGEIKRGSQVNIIREQERIGTGKINSLQQNKKEVNSVAKGLPCGMLLETEALIKEQDILEVFVEEKGKKEL